MAASFSQPRRAESTSSGRSTFGHSIIISPWGEVLAEAEKEPGVILADIDVTEVDRVRARIPALDHTRTLMWRVVPLAEEAKLAAAE